MRSAVSSHSGNSPEISHLALEGMPSSGVASPFHNDGSGAARRALSEGSAPQPADSLSDKTESSTESLRKAGGNHSIERALRGMEMPVRRRRTLSFMSFSSKQTAEFAFARGNELMTRAMLVFRDQLAASAEGNMPSVQSIITAVVEELDVDRFPGNEKSLALTVLAQAMENESEADFFKAGTGVFPSEKLVRSLGLQGQFVHTADNQIFQIIDRLTPADREALGDVSFKIKNNGELYRVDGDPYMNRTVRLATRIDSIDSFLQEKNYVTVKQIYFQPKDALATEAKLSMKNIVQKENRLTDELKNYPGMRMESAVTSYVEMGNTVYQFRNLHRDGSSDEVIDAVRSYLLSENGKTQARIKEDKEKLEICNRMFAIKLFSMARDFEKLQSADALAGKRDADGKKIKPLKLFHGDSKLNNFFLIYRDNEYVFSLTDFKCLKKGNKLRVQRKHADPDEQMDIGTRMLTESPPAYPQYIHSISSDLKLSRKRVYGAAAYQDPRLLYPMSDEEFNLTRADAQKWSFGAILYTIANGKMHDKHEKNKTGQAWYGESSLNQKAGHTPVEIAERLMCAQPDLRPSNEAVLAMPWMQGKVFSEAELHEIITEAMKLKRVELKQLDSESAILMPSISE